MTDDVSLSASELNVPDFELEEEIELFSADYNHDTGDDSAGDLSDLLVYRNVSVMQAPTLFGAWNTNSCGFKDSSILTNVVTHQNQTKKTMGSSIRLADTAVSFSEPPFGLPDMTQFSVPMETNSDILSNIDQFFKSSERCADFDFSFVPEDNTWKGKCLLGSGCIEIETRVYSSQVTSEYVVAVVKMKGAEPFGISFMDFFFQLREHMTGEQPKKRRKLNFTMSPSSMSTPPTEEQFLKGITPIISMAQDERLDVRLEAAKMMCDLSKKSERYLELEEVRQLCAPILEALVQDKFDDVRQHAVMALASFLELPSYQDAILSATSVLLPVLFSAIDNAPNHQKNSWETAKVRRTAAGIVAVLSSRNATAVRGQLESVHGIDVLTWAEQILPVLQDAKTKEYARLIQQNIFSITQPSFVSCSFKKYNFVAGVSR